MGLESSNTYRRNLSALCITQPSIASVIESTLVPDGVAPIKGRDNSDTFMIPAADGHGRWLGGSSMPTISALEMWNGLRGDGRNLILPGILTGLEPLLILERIPAISALFVCEDDTLNLKLALMLRDYARYIESGQLIFIPGSEQLMVDRLVEFFECNSGYEVPVHLLPVPQQSEAQATQLRTLVETAARKIAGIHAREVELLVRKINSGTQNTGSGQTRVAVVSADPSRGTQDFACQLGRALESMGCLNALGIPRNPQTCHLSARFKAVEQVRADLVIQLNDDGGLFRDVLSSAIPLVTWFSSMSSSVVSDSFVDGTAKHPADRIVTSTAPQTAACIQAGIAKERVMQCDSAADVLFVNVASTLDESSASERIQIMVLCDLPDDRAEQCGVEQASHVALWNALQSEAFEAAMNAGVIDVEDLVTKAQQRSATILKEEQVVQHFVGLARERIVPAARARAVATVLDSNPCAYGLYGRNWFANGAAFEKHLGEIPVGVDRERLFRSAMLVVLPVPSVHSIPWALDAVMAGIPVALHRTGSETAPPAPVVAELDRFIHSFRSAKDIEAIVHGVLSGTSDSGVQEARKIIGSGHTMKHRMRQVLELVGMPGSLHGHHSGAQA